jgi:hypothetical protein
MVKMKMVRIPTSKMRVKGGDRCNVRLRAIVNRITRLGRFFTRNSDLLQ